MEIPPKPIYILTVWECKTRELYPASGIGRSRKAEKGGTGNFLIRIVISWFLPKKRYFFPKTQTILHALERSSFSGKKCSRISKNPAVGVKFKYINPYIITQKLYFERERIATKFWSFFYPLAVFLKPSLISNVLENGFPWLITLFTWH